MTFKENNKVSRGFPFIGYIITIELIVETKNNRRKTRINRYKNEGN